MKKVYCKDCKYLKDRFLGYECINMKPYDTWYTNEFTIGFPEDRNRNNDCKWFEAKK